MSSGPLPASGRLDAGEQLHRPQVDVLIELEPQFQQQALFQDARLHVGMADGAEVDGVELPELVDAAGGQRFAGLQVALAAPVEVLRFVGELFELADGGQDLEGFGGHFGTGAVAGNDGQFERGHDELVGESANVAAIVFCGLFRHMDGGTLALGSAGDRSAA